MSRQSLGGEVSQSIPGPLSFLTYFKQSGHAVSEQLNLASLALSREWTEPDPTHCTSADRARCSVSPNIQYAVPA